ATRYVMPLREGGSLPAVVEADDDGLYVLKFRGAGQGPKALIAEWVAGEIARAAGLVVPEIVFIELDGDLARTEPDAEIQDLIRASAGLNLALDYLPGAVAFDPLVHPVAADVASAIVWFDAFVTNPDRTARNTNLLVWHRRLWLIDHGAALYFHHDWDNASATSMSAFPRIKDHVLLRFATRLQETDVQMVERITPGRIADIVQAIPDAWLAPEPAFAGANQQREAYTQALAARLQSPRAFVEEAIRARAMHV
ncbi:MAG TPA: HipA family kinase, partial [Burkholderiaceae bacterium]|nr:HipA family kinase [Burkholderiaceae bacterium]